MGNILEPDYDKIRFCRESEPVKYMFEIHVDEFNIHNISQHLDSYTDDKGVIIKILEHIQNTETTELLEQVDGYLFHKLRGQMPYLAIINVNAKHKQTANNVTNGGFYYKYTLS